MGEAILCGSISVAPVCIVSYTTFAWDYDTPELHFLGEVTSPLSHMDTPSTLAESTVGGFFPHDADVKNGAHKEPI